ncbi:MAG: hypothetical protein A2252_00700 [Elusimicrobia bacterium RIFOXYA2_FULL_39_19]|nr:MAG: hypothetical protein A2252_00700 [Elusimicrobia bacterium RIFOXYA2_FULL_39_19]
MIKKSLKLALIVICGLILVKPASSVTFVSRNDTWRYLAPSTDVSGWNTTSFDDSAWSSGAGIFGYGESYITTTINIQNVSPTIYIRKTFNVVGLISSATLSITYDDGYVAYINGTMVSNAGVDSGAAFSTLASPAHESSQIYTSVDVPTNLINIGSNILALEVHNDGTDSSDLVINADLTGAINGALTPCSLSGQIATGGGSGIGSVTVGYTGGVGGLFTGSVTGSSTGYYIINGISSGTYVITPTKTDYTFSPVSRSMNLTGDATGYNFTGTFTGSVQILENGPYISYMSSTIAIISWITQTQTTTNTLDFGPTNAYGTSVNSYSDASATENDGTFYTHHAKIANLSPSTQYYYRVTSDGTSSNNAGAGWAFTTFPAEGSQSSLRFAVMGDTQHQTEVSGYVVYGERAMRGIYAENPPLVLHTGDQVGSPTNSAQMLYWNYSGSTAGEFFKIAGSTAMPLMQKTWIAPCIGNHDDTGFAPYYPVRNTIYEFPNSSNGFGTNGSEDYYAFTYGNARIISIRHNGGAGITAASGTQYDWLHAELDAAQSQGKWIIVLLHAPIFTQDNSKYNDSTYSAGQTVLAPLFQTHSVNLVINGHNGVSNIFRRALSVSGGVVTESDYGVHYIGAHTNSDPNAAGSLVGGVAQARVGSTWQTLQSYTVTADLNQTRMPNYFSIEINDAQCTVVLKSMENYEDDNGNTVPVILSSMTFMKSAAYRNITGYVRTGAGTGIGNTVLALSGTGGLISTYTTTSNGYYSFSVTTGSTYGITPVKTNWAFVLSSQTFTNVSADASQNFTGTFAGTSYNISGTVLDNLGAAMSSATVTLSGDLGMTVYTNTSGNYTLSSVPGGGTYGITPTKTDYIFNPSSLTLANLSADQTGQNFTGISEYILVCGFENMTGISPNESNVDATLSLTQTGTYVSQGSNALSVVHNSGGGNYPGIAMDTSAMLLTNWAGYTGLYVDIYNPGVAITIDYRIDNTTGAILTGSDIDIVPGRSTLSISLTGETDEDLANMTDVLFFILGPGDGGLVALPHTLYYDNLRLRGTGTGYSIGGTVATSTSAPVGGVTVTLSGGASATTTTGANGAYAFYGLQAGNYTVTAQRLGYSFTPAPASVTVTNANVVQNITAAGIPMITKVIQSMEDTVGITGGEGEQTLTLESNPAYVTQGTNALKVVHSTGAYPGILLEAEAFGITDWANFTTLAFNVYNPGAGLVNMNFVLRNTDMQRYEQTNISLSPGANTVTIDLAAIRTSTMTLGIDINEMIFYLDAAEVTLPQTLYYDNIVLLSTDTVSVTYYSISGYVRTGASVGITSATVKLSGTETAVATTGSDGVYTFTYLTSGGTYTIIPSKISYVFTPVSIDVTSLGSNLTGQNFQGDNTTIYNNVVCTFETLTALEPNEDSTQAALTVVSNSPYVTQGSNALKVDHTSGDYPGFGMDAGAFAYTNWASGTQFKMDVYNPNAFDVAICMNFRNTAMQTYQKTDFLALASTKTILSMDLSLVKTSTWTSSMEIYSMTVYVDTAEANVALPISLYYDNMVVVSTYAFSGSGGGEVGGGGTELSSGVYAMSGCVANVADVGMVGVTLTLSGAAGATVTTDADGDYSFTGLSSGTYTVTPVKTGYSFSPSKIVYTITTSSNTTANFRVLPAGAVTTFKLYNNEMNPRKDQSVTIMFKTTSPGNVKVEVYDTRGTHVKTIIDEEKNADLYNEQWDGKTSDGTVLPSGIYLIHIEAPGISETKKVCIIK